MGDLAVLQYRCGLSVEFAFVKALDFATRPAYNKIEILLMLLKDYCVYCGAVFVEYK